MPDLSPLLSRQLSRGRIWFTRKDALELLPPPALTAALSKLIRKGAIANPRKRFDKGAPDPKRWIHALMQHQQIDYRISLLTAAHLHGEDGAPTAPNGYKSSSPTPARRSSPASSSRSSTAQDGCTRRAA